MDPLATLERGLSGLPEGARLLLAVSGGADSVALLHAAARWREERRPKTPLFVGHFDHRLRPTSAEDARFVRETAAALGIPTRVGVALPDADLSSEGRARRARYAFLIRAAREVEATHVATAHTRDDQAETVVDRLTRGTGIRGLRGILPERRLAGSTRLIRPLLAAGRAELRVWLAERELPWREDPTNEDLGPRRNRIRADLLPALDALGPGGIAAIARVATHARETWELLRRDVAKRLATAVTEDDEALRLDREALRRAPAAARWPMLAGVLVRAGYRPRGLGSRSIDEAVRIATEGRAGARWERRNRARFEVERTRISFPRRPSRSPSARPSNRA